MENGKEIENNGVCSVESINGSRDVWSSKDSDSSSADHLVIMVNGILGSAADWKFGANQFVKAFPDKVVVHCSERNSASLTLDGVDVMGDRLAEEVLEVIKRNPNVRKISFIAHSVGGLVARYAIGKLYKPAKKETADSLSAELEKESGGTIGGLEAMNFITVATPHLGSRGNKNVPFLFGLTAIESLANCVIHWIFRRTGRHLFLNDDDEGKPPLLKRMLEDNGECYFLSALRTFKRRVIYSNMQYDHIVGWRTSSIRRICDLPKCEGPIDEKYPHIVREEHCPAIEGDHSEPTSSSVGGDSSVKLEEELVTGLSRLSWEKVDVNFRSSSQKFAAHSVIQVKDEVAHIDGADVIQHMIDRFLT